jgi:hypothetical protein
MYTIVDRYDNERETWSKSTLPAAMLANIQIVSFFVAGMFEFYHRYSVLNAGVLKD